jgi:hypothetical protein
MPGQVTAIANAIKEGLALWKTFIATRQEAYNRQQDKRKRMAIDVAEKYIMVNDELLRETNGNRKKKLVSLLDHWKRKFFKLNQ